MAVVGSVNLDLVARLPRLPAAGETLTATAFDRVPGGKGANQALAARRLGAQVRLVAAVGDDALADEALALLRTDGVDTSAVTRHAGTATGLAMIEVDDTGETTIVVVPAANSKLRVEPGQVAGADAVLTVLEVPDEAVSAAAAGAGGFFAVNAAPARPIPPDALARADLVVVNRAEYAMVPGLAGARLVAVTLGAEGAVLLRGGQELCRARPPAVRAVDGTAAGDAFTAALVLGLAGGPSAPDALGSACAAGALTASRAGAQPSLPTAAEVAELVRR
ncbi:MAG TPA: ribokinase [Pseudonocardiaceae bacterium]|nr:ribokinase [Pseudonocardiaceae bacterium]